MLPYPGDNCFINQLSRVNRVKEGSIFFKFLPHFSGKFPASVTWVIRSNPSHFNSCSFYRLVLEENVPNIIDLFSDKLEEEEIFEITGKYFSAISVKNVKQLIVMYLLTCLYTCCLYVHLLSIKFY